MVRHAFDFAFCKTQEKHDTLHLFKEAVLRVKTKKKNAPTIIIQQRSWISRDSDLVTRAKGIVTIIQIMKIVDGIRMEAVGKLWW